MIFFIYSRGTGNSSTAGCRGIIMLRLDLENFLPGTAMASVVVKGEQGLAPPPVVSPLG